MNFAALSEVIFKAGRGRPHLTLSFIRALPLWLIYALRKPGLKETLHRASHISFYREEFAKAGIDVNRIASPEEMGTFFLTREIVKSRPELILSGTPALAIESSGTSGHVSRVYLGRDEMNYYARQGGLLYALYDLKPEDRLLCTFDLSFGLGALLVQNWVRFMPLFAMVVGRVDPKEAYSRLADYQFNIIVSDPFWLARLTEIAREQGKPAPIKLMIGGGEGISDRTRSQIEEFWGAPLYMTYASAEAATTLGFECPVRRGYHVNEFDFFVEIDRPDPEGYGELVITTITRRVMPLIRYRTGDVARWLEGRCDCGLPFRRISPICGRVDEQVSCAWGNIYPDFFDRILGPVPGLADDWQVAVCERSGKQTFEFRLEVQNGISHQEIKDRIFNLIKSEHPSAWQTYVQKLAGVEFNFFPSGSLRAGRKLLRLVDERQNS